jgi:hypothetical protein
MNVPAMIVLAVGIGVEKTWRYGEAFGRPWPGPASCAP